MNALSFDIEHRTEKYECECEVKSTLAGCLIQDLENNMLKAFNQSPYKKPLPYHYTSGYVSFGPDDTLGRHAFIAAPLHHIVEAAADPSDDDFSPYQVPCYDDFTFGDCPKGRMFVSINQGDQTPYVYASYLDKKALKSTYDNFYAQQRLVSFAFTAGNP